MDPANNIKISKQQAELIKDLYSTDELKVIETINTLRDKGGDFSIIPLMDIYFNTSFDDVRKSIGMLLCDIKNNNAAVIILNNLSQYSRNKHLNTFLSNLWQSSLRFEDIDILIDIFIDGEDKVAFEILTIIEQNILFFSDEHKYKSVIKLESNINNFQDFKYNLTTELIELLK